MAGKPLADVVAITEHSSPLLTKWMAALAAAEVANDLAAKQTAIDELSGVISRAMARADVAGRRRFLAQVIESSTSPAQIAKAMPPIMENVSEIVTKLYLEQHGPSISREIDQNLTDRVTAAFSSGLTEASDVLQEVGDWTRAYSDTVYRTNLSTAYAAGQWQQALDPDVLAVSPAFEYSATGDRDTRPNHQAMNGLLAGVIDPIWNTYSIPNGYNCRCALRSVDIFELKKRGLLNDDGSVKRVIPSNFSQAHPDKGFGGARPDQRVYSLVGR